MVIGKNLVSNFWSVGKSISKNNPMVLQTDNARKKITCWNISMKLFRRWLAVAFGVILFQLSVKYNNEREMWNKIKYPDR